ncbi:hypothetical protein PSHT_02425 [Puccinia striiformis]|uniref:RRM domain-containing protein n=1 Tax=Puccinia striiformis TaxID=27350 RepID=A0A2S4WI31_9BASI|nr:hypothetical protein PSHT_02425 [Puccinia striiformis]
MSTPPRPGSSDDVDIDHLIGHVMTTDPAAGPAPLTAKKDVVEMMIGKGLRSAVAAMPNAVVVMTNATAIATVVKGNMDVTVIETVTVTGIVIVIVVAPDMMTGTETETAAGTEAMIETETVIVIVIAFPDETTPVMVAVADGADMVALAAAAAVVVMEMVVGADGGVFGSPNIRRSPTPEGTIPISKRPRKYTAWDVKPAGYANVLSCYPDKPAPAPGGPVNGNGSAPGNMSMNHSNFSSHPPMNSNHHWVNPNSQNAQAQMAAQHGTQFQNSMGRDGSFAAPGSLPPIHFKPAQGQSGPVAQTQSFARQARRLYVGNILHTANEMNVAEFFNAKMKELGLLARNNEDGMAISISENPVVAVQVNHEKNYAFVEFRNAEEATHGMSFDGIIFQNQALKIRRPKDYTGPDHAGPTHIPGVVSTNVPDSPNKIFIGGLPSYLTDDQVMELLKSFGELKSFNLVKDTSSGGHVSKGFAFCEYVDPDLTDIACQGLNGMELGDRYLVVQRAQIGQNAKKEKENNPDGQRANFNQFNNFAGGQATAAASTVLAAVKTGEGEKTRVLQMLNMVNQEELVDDQEYGEILEDIRDECGKYGKIENVRIPRPIKSEKGRIDLKASESVEGLGKVFVMFEKVEECAAALLAIAGRQFAGRVIICAYAPEDAMIEGAKPEQPTKEDVEEETPAEENPAQEQPAEEKSPEETLAEEETS